MSNSIDYAEWGITKVGGKTYKDVVAISTAAGGDSFGWDWAWDAQDPMHHRPGIREKDLDHLILCHYPTAEHVILSTGRQSQLLVNRDLILYLRDRGVENVHILDTNKAINLYNLLNKDNKRVIALIHSTC